MKKKQKKDRPPGSSDMGKLLTDQWKLQPIANTIKKSKWEIHTIDGVVLINVSRR